MVVSALPVTMYNLVEEVFVAPKGGEEMTDLDRYIEKQLVKLQSNNANARYDACEMLKVAPSIPSEAVNALQKTLNDPNPDVVDAARRALNVHQVITPVTEQGSSTNQVISPESRAPSTSYNPNQIASVLKAIAWITFLLGFIAGIIIAIYAETIVAGLLYWFAAFISGIIFLGFAEIIDLLQRLVDKKK